MIRANSLNLHIEKNGGPGRRRFKKEDKENPIYLNIPAGAIRRGWDQLDGEAACRNLNRRNSTLGNGRGGPFRSLVEYC